MKKVIAGILIAFFALATISISRTVSQRPPDSDPAGLLGYLLGAVLFPIAGLFFSVRWYLTLSGHTQKTSTQAWLYILRPYALLGIVMCVVLMMPPKANMLTLIGVPMAAFWVWSIYASTKWLRHTHAVEAAGPTTDASLGKRPPNPAPYTLVVLVALFLVIGFTSYHAALPSVRRERADRELKAIPFYRIISEVDPQTYQKILAITLDGTEKGQSMDATLSQLLPVVTDTIPKYIGSASDESVVAMMDTTLRRVEALRDAHSEACYYTLFPEENGAPPMSTYFDYQTNRDSLAALGGIMQSAVHSPQSPPDTAKAKALLMPVYKQLRKVYGDDLRLLTEKPSDSAERQRVCDISIELYTDIASFPERKDAGLLLRYLLSSQTSSTQPTTQIASQGPQSGPKDDPLNLDGPENKPLDACLSKENPADPGGLYDETPQQAAKRADCIKKFGKQ